MAGLSTGRTLGWRATDCICRNACYPVGILKGCQKGGVSWIFFSPPERPQCWKGHGRHKNWSKRSSCLSVRPLQSMQSIPSLSLSFSLCPTLSSNNLCRSHSFLTAHLFISIRVVWEAHCGRARLIWNWSIMQWAKKNGFPQIIVMYM